MSRILVVGASGFLGSAVTARLRTRGHEVPGTYHANETGWADEPFDFFADDPAALVDENDPGVVVFAAFVERTDHDRAAFEAAVERFVDACAGRRLVYVSSDAVFDGAAGRYDESAPRSPASEYGRRLARFEDAVRDRARSVVVRPSYVYGVAPTGLDPRLERTREAVRAGESVAYYRDMYRSPVEVRTAAAAVGRLATGGATGVVHLAAPPTSVYAFHRDAMAALGLDAGLVRPEPMPDDDGLARDRSLTSTRLTDLTGIDVPPVDDALADDPTR